MDAENIMSSYDEMKELDNYRRNLVYHVHPCSNCGELTQLQLMNYPQIGENPIWRCRRCSHSWTEEIEII